MESEKCVFCKKLLSDEETVKLTEKGCNRINNDSDKRDDSITVTVGQIVHIKCRKTYTNDYNVQKRKLLLDTQDEDALSLRSQSQVFSYETDCLFCGKTIPEYMFRASSQKYLAYNVRTETFQKEIKAKCAI